MAENTVFLGHSEDLRKQFNYNYCMFAFRVSTVFACTGTYCAQ